MRPLYFLSLISLLIALAVPSAMVAADHPIRGDWLRMHAVRGQHSAIFRTSGDPAIDPSTVPDPRRVGATLEILGGGAGFGSSGQIMLAPQFWMGLGDPAGSLGYRYVDLDSRVGVKQVVFRSGRGGGTLAITAGGAHWPFAIDEPQHTISVRLTIGGELYCALFNRQDLARREVGLLSASKAPAPASCGPSVCGNGAIEPGEECDSPLLGAPGCCLRGCVLDSDDFCRPSFANPENPEKAKATTRFAERIEKVLRDGTQRQDSPRVFGKFRSYVDQLDTRITRPSKLFDLAAALFAYRPDLIQSFRSDVRRFTPVIAANDTAMTLTDDLRRTLEKIDLEIGPPAAPPDYAQTRIGEFDPGLVSVSEGPVVQDPYAVANGCNGYQYCAVYPLHFQSLTVPEVPEAEIVAFNDYCPNSSDCQWPIKYDLMPRRMYITWNTTLPLSEVDDILAENGYAIAISVNGTYINPKGPPLPYANDNPQQAWWGATTPCDANNTTGCLMTILITPSLKNVLNPATLPWNIKLEISKLEGLDPPQVLGIDENGNPIIAAQQAVPFADASVTITPNGSNATTFFEAMLLPTFKSDRCMDCHGFGTFENLSNHHWGYGFDDTNSELVPSAYDPAGQVMKCYNCHDGVNGNPHTSLEASWAGGVFSETEWKAPYVDLNLDWRNKTAPEICARVKENLPTHELRRKHFHEDARLFWAIQDPKVFGEYLLPRAYPEDFALFLKYVDSWNDNGAPCP